MTHTFEVEINGFNLDGEVDLNAVGVPEICTENPINLSLPKYKALGELLLFCFNLTKGFGEIQKIEITKKQY